MVDTFEYAWLIADHCSFLFTWRKSIQNDLIYVKVFPIALSSKLFTVYIRVSDSGGAYYEMNVPTYT